MYMIMETQVIAANTDKNRKCNP